jgi:hypothetical protein
MQPPHSPLKIRRWALQIFFLYLTVKYNQRKAEKQKLWDAQQEQVG